MASEIDKNFMCNEGRCFENNIMVSINPKRKENLQKEIQVLLTQDERDALFTSNIREKVYTKFCK